MVEKSAVLELLSDNQGLLFSRISDTNVINALIPPDGMVIFFTGTKQLLVRSNGYWQPLLFSAALGNNYWSVNGNSNGALKKLGTTDNFALPFVTNNTEWMRLTTGGNLGIGNTAPSEKLDITGNLKFSGALMPNNTAGTAGYLLTSAGTGAAPTWTNPSTLISSSSWILNGNGVSSLTSLGTTSAFDLPFITSNTERMRLTTTGRLGIGNTVPTEVLDVTGNMKFSGALMPNNAAGTSGYLLTSAGTGAAPTWTNPATVVGSTSWILNGNNVSSVTSIGTTSAFDLPFITSNTERMRLTTTGRLGIGNTAPTEVLDVTGNMKFSGALMPGNSAGTSGYLLTSAGTGTTPTWTNPTTVVSSSAWALNGNNVSSLTRFGTTSVFDLPFITSNTERMRLTTTGRLGIGNTAPTEVLDVTGNMKFSGALMPNNAAGTSGYLLTSAGTGAAPTWTNPTTLLNATSWALNGNGVGSVTTIGTTTAFDLPFITSNTERMRLTTTGRLGIGNTAPTEVLDVTGNMKLSGALMPNNTAGTSGYLLTSAGTGTAPTWTNPSTLIGSSAWSLGGNGVASTTNIGTTTGFDLPFITSNTERMRLTTAGRLGIGNTTPTEILDVTGNMKFSGALMPNNTAGTSGYLLTSAGTGSAPTWTNPTTLLNATSWALNGNGVSNTTSIGTTTFFDLPFITSNTERMRLTTSGNLGIGNTTPSEKLDVTGNMKFSGALMPNNTAGTSGYLLTSAGTGSAPTWTNPSTLIGSSAWSLGGNGVASTTNIGTTTGFDLPFITSNTERMRLTTAGRLGIGNTTPTEILDVTGNMKFSGALMPNNTAGTSGYLLTSAGTGSAPTWTNPSTLIGATAWALGGNSVSSTSNFGTTSSFDLPFITANTERMRITNTGRVGIGVTNPANPLVVKDTLEIRRTGTLSELLFTNTSGTGDFRIGSDGNDIFWQGGGGRNLQMGAFWTVVLTGDRQSSTFPAYTNGTSGTGVLVQGQRDASVPLAIQANSATQSSNLTEWRNSSGAALSAINNTGRLGLGNNAPAEVLDVTGNMKFSGALMPGNTAGTSGYLLASSGAGTAPTWTNPATLIGNTAWALGGNAVTTTTNMGTTTAFDLPFITNNTEKMRITSSGNVGIGSSSFDVNNAEKLLVDAGTNTQSYNVISGKGTINNYLQLNIQNRSSGDVASSDLVATANNGSETANFVDLGINSSGFTNTVYPIIGGANNAYLYSTGNDFVIGNAISGKNLRFFTGGYATTNERMRIDGSGNVGIGTTLPSTTLHVKSTATDDSGLRLENLTSSSATTSNAAVLGVDATGKVVRAKRPVYYSGGAGGGTATTEDVTKVWVVDVANTSTGIQTITFPTNVTFTNVLNIQVTAKGGSGGITVAPIATVTSNTNSSVTIRVMESKSTTVVLLNTAVEGLEPHTDTNTRIYIRVEGN
ncbi:MAG: hypothetical protein QM731_19830 [Chitinophagaceae bacterium]